MSLALANRIEILRDRAEMLASIRLFFAQKHVLEVDVPLLSQRASIDAHIDLIEATCMGRKAFLHSSPEYGMKRLLAEGIGDIYQISHVFRDFESGERHNPEFTLIEWYRQGFSLKEMIEETLALIHLFIPPATYETLSYQEAFERYVGFMPESIEQRDQLFAFEIEPHLKHTVICDFPKEQAALAQVAEDGTAERFEIYYQGIELANGYQELFDAKEQKKRLEEENQKRVLLGKQIYPIDFYFLEALEAKIVDTCGVACGFDRLMMLRHSEEKIETVIPFSWSRS